MTTGTDEPAVGESQVQSDAPGTLAGRHGWTLAAVGGLVLIWLSNLWGLSALDVNPTSQVFGLAFVALLAWLAWRETRFGGLIVAAVCLLWGLVELVVISAAPDPV